MSEPEFPQVVVDIDDGAPLREIIARVEKRMRNVGVKSKDRARFLSCVPCATYSETIHEIRKWVTA